MRTRVLVLLGLAAVVAACSSQPQPTDPAAPAATTPAPADTTAAAPDTAAPPVATPTTAPPAAPSAAPGAAPAARPATRPPATAEPATMPAAPPAPVPARAPAPPVPEYREVTVPAGSTISVVTDTTVASDKSAVEDVVRGFVKSAVVIDGLTAIPANAKVTGAVTEATRSGKVKGLARIAFRFTRLDVPDGEEYALRTAAIAREAQSTKGEDAKKVGIGAGVGAVIGGIAGGGKGAAIGAAVGGGAGTGAVMATRGDEVSVPAGTTVRVELTAPLVVRVRVR